MSEAVCVKCKAITPHQHMHDCAHGIYGTHMAGTERYECRVCGYAIYAMHAAGNEHLQFYFDEDIPDARKPCFD
jgi:hypothetical protein